MCFKLIISNNLLIRDAFSSDKQTLLSIIKTRDVILSVSFVDSFFAIVVGGGAAASVFIVVLDVIPYFASPTKFAETMKSSTTIISLSSPRHNIHKATLATFPIIFIKKESFDALEILLILILGRVIT